jgi:hypothetical protein
MLRCRPFAYLRLCPLSLPPIKHNLADKRKKNLPHWGLASGEPVAAALASAMNPSGVPTHQKKDKSLASRFWTAAVDTFTGHREEEDYLIYITKRLIICPLSAKADNSQEGLQHKRKVQATVRRLKRDHGDHFLIWNMTRPDAALFDSKEFGDQVLDVTTFPLYVPTLHFTFNFCNMIRYWLKQDPLNVAVILYEDQCGRAHVDPLNMTINSESRIAYLVSAFLAYQGETKTAFDALDNVTEIRGKDSEVAFSLYFFCF